MYALKPTQVYVLEDVFDDPKPLARATRMATAMGVSLDEAVRYNRATALDVAREINAWPCDTLVADVPKEHQRPVIFTRSVIGAEVEDEPLVNDCPDEVLKPTLGTLLGYIAPVKPLHIREDDAERNYCCWPTFDFGTIAGCSHGCQYCGAGRQGNLLAISVNIEELIERVFVPTMKEHPEQKCFRLIGWGSDHITLEPECNTIAPMLQMMADYDDEHYLYFHSNSDNVDWIKDLPNRDRLISIWSLACDAMSKAVEPGAPTTAKRVEAIGKCVDWGVPARIKFKPIVPVPGWRESYAELVEQIFARTKPETIGFCVIMWMDYPALIEKIPEDQLDPELLAAAREAAPEMQGVRVGPYPHEARKTVYQHLIREVRKHDAHIPLYISTESPEMWDDLAAELGQNPKTFMCGCNPIQAPGPRLMPSKALTYSTYMTPDKLAALEKN